MGASASQMLADKKVLTVGAFDGTSLRTTIPSEAVTDPGILYL